MYEKIKTVIIEGDEITIYKNYQGEYIVEFYDVSGTSNQINCGTDYFDIATKVQEALGDIYTDAYELLHLAELVFTQLSDDTTIQVIESTTATVLMHEDALYSREVLEEVIHIVDSRYGRVSHDRNVRVKFDAMAPLEAWLNNAITSMRIYRLDTANEYDEQAVRIMAAHPMPNGDYMMSFAIMEIVEGDQGYDVWSSKRLFMKPLSCCTLYHDLEDEVSPCYQC